MLVFPSVVKAGSAGDLVFVLRDSTDHVHDEEHVILLCMRTDHPRHLIYDNIA